MATALRALRTSSTALSRVRPCPSPQLLRPVPIRFLTVDHRNRLSNFFAPSGGIADTKGGEEDIHALLIRTGYLRQAHSGVFHYLPLGLRVHEKLERLIDKHMRSIGASKLSLSTITSEKLWEKSGRLQKGGSEFFRFKDRKGTKYLLSPTHEEEITSLVGSLVGSHKQLPLRVYQIGRKYRDERRPRAGLLRGREFTMKDLYTFDTTEQEALATYKEVRIAYKNLFDELRLPYLVAEADSGDMGGSLSHEYLYPSETGEDTVISCTECDYTSNTEAAVPRPPQQQHSIDVDPASVAVHHSITTDRKTLICTYYVSSASSAHAPAPAEVNSHRLKSLVPNLDPSVATPLDHFYDNFTPYTPASEPGTYSQIINLFDGALPQSYTENSFSNHTDHPALAFIADKRLPTTSIRAHPSTGAPLSLMKARAGDRCLRCDAGVLRATTAVELGHTFHLGTRYTEPLNAAVFDASQNRVPMVMGCHGLGVSRMIPAIAAALREGKELRWPRVVAPWEVAVVAHPEGAADAEAVYDVLASAVAGKKAVEAIIDDRERPLVWKMKDADLVGYPVFCVLGKAWKKEQKVEVQCKRMGVRVEVPVEEVRDVVEGLLAEL